MHQSMLVNERNRGKQQEIREKREKRQLLIVLKATTVTWVPVSVRK